MEQNAPESSDRYFLTNPVDNLASAVQRAPTVFVACFCPILPSLSSFVTDGMIDLGQKA